MYFVMDPPIDSGTTDMGAGYCLVGELVYTISHPGVVPSLFDGREEISQWLADAAGSSSKFVNILSTAVLLPAITGSIQWSLFCSAHICIAVSDILIVCYTITMSTDTDCSTQEVCSVADTLSTVAFSQLCELL